MTFGKVCVIVVIFSVNCGAFAEEQTGHQRIAVESHRRFEVFLNGGVTIQPSAERQFRSVVSIVDGTVNAELGTRVLERIDFAISGQLPVTIERSIEQGVAAGYRQDGVASFETGYSIGPVFRRIRVAGTMDTQRVASGSANAILIRDPMVHTVGIVVTVPIDEPDRITAQTPFSTALVTNDVTSLHLEIIPLIRNSPSHTQLSFAAVVSIRWGWEHYHFGTSTYLRHKEGPSELAFQGGWIWRPES